MTTSTFTPAMLAEQTAAWKAAAVAFRDRDPQHAADLLAPPQDDSDAYVRGVTICVIGAICCAREIAEQREPAPEGHLWVLRARKPGPIDPAFERAVQCVTYALNADWPMLADLVNAWHRADDAEPGTDLMFELLMIYLAVSE